MTTPVPTPPATPGTGPQPDTASSRAATSPAQSAPVADGGKSAPRGYVGRHRRPRSHPLHARARPRMVATFVFAATVAATNWLTTRYRLLGLGLGLTASAGTYAAAVRGAVSPWRRRSRRGCSL